MSDSVNYKEITQKGLWGNNAALVQLLGLCPLLAVSGSVVNGLGLGLATLLVLTSSNTIVSLIRTKVSDAVRLPAFVMIIASLTTCIELRALSNPRYLYPADRNQLCGAGPRRCLCEQKPFTAVHRRRFYHGYGFRIGVGGYRSHSRTAG